MQPTASDAMAVVHGFSRALAGEPPDVEDNIPDGCISTPGLSTITAAT